MSGPAASGPYRPGPTLLVCAVPVLTFGILGMVPALVLAAGRRRAVDIVGAVVFTVLQLLLYVAAGLAPHGDTHTVYDKIGMTVLLPLWLGAPVYFLVMNRPGMWPAPKHLPQPYPAYPGQQFLAPSHPTPAYPAQPYAGPSHPTPPYPAQPYAAQPYAGPSHPTPPYPAQPYDRPPVGAAPTAAPATTGEDLQQLGELLRRQARAQEDRP